MQLWSRTAKRMDTGATVCFLCLSKTFVKQNIDCHSLFFHQVADCEPVRPPSPPSFPKSCQAKFTLPSNYNESFIEYNVQQDPENRSLYKPGSYIKFSCKKGFFVYSSHNLTTVCLPNGTWTYAVSLFLYCDYRQKQLFFIFCILRETVSRIRAGKSKFAAKLTVLKINFNSNFSLIKATKTAIKW
jgi:hypothetical protein